MVLQRLFKPTNLFFLCMLLPGYAASDHHPDDAPATANVEVYQGPSLKKGQPPTYPRLALQQRIEGFVTLNFMIDTKGKPYEISVEDSTHPTLEPNAVRAAKRFIFEPAQRGGELLDAGHTFRMNFVMQGHSPARKPFRAAYRDIRDAIQNNDRDAADQVLKTIGDTGLNNNSEYLIFHMSHFFYHERWGTEQEQFDSLRAAMRQMRFEEINEALYRANLLKLLGYQTRFRHFAAALKTYEDIMETGIEDEALIRDLERTVIAIEQLQNDDRSFSIQGAIPSGYSWFHQLLKNEFTLTNVEGDIAEIKLRCNAAYIFWRYEPDVRYHAEDANGRCRMEVLGDPGTTFTLVQM
ncbi:MAG: energy transducer TonB [Pseudomonadota bacterium]